MIFSEIGIPYDMDDKHAYKTGDYSSQVRAMDANHFALEGSTANGFTLWLYTSLVCPHIIPPFKSADGPERPRMGRPLERRGLVDLLW